jgi:hypothetical protein
VNRFAAAVAVAAVILGGGYVRADADGSSADVTAAARAGGNRKDVALRIGQALFATVWPAQLVKVRVDGAGPHEVAGLIISGVKFHARLDERAFTREVVALVSRTFAVSAVEEVDVWATIPLAVVPHEVVGGDLAQPTSRIVYAATVVRGEQATFSARLLRGDQVFWDPAWRTSLGGPLPVAGAPGKG